MGNRYGLGACWALIMWAGCSPAPDSRPEPAPPPAPVVLQSPTIDTDAQAEATMMNADAGAGSGTPFDFKYLPASRFVFETNAEHYVFARTHEEAVSAFRTWLDEVGVPEDRLEIVAPSARPADYAIAEAEMAALWPSFEQMFPNDTKDAPIPRVVLVADPSVNAFVAHAAEGKRSPFVVAFTTGLFEGGFSPAQVGSVLAHELGHLLMKHGLGDNGARVLRVYPRTQKAPETLGLIATHDEAFAHAFEDRQTLATDVGTLRYPEVMDLPISRRDTRSELARSFLNALFTGTNAACESAYFKYWDVERLSLAEEAPAAQTLAEVRVAAEAALVPIAACMQGQRAVTEQLADLGTIGTRILNRLPATTRTALATMGALAGFRRMTRELGAIEAASETNIKLSDVRHYTAEEQSDDVSLMAFAVAGRNPTALGDMFTRVMSEEERADCTRQRAGGAVPAVGDLSDPHHSDCFRVDHVHRLSAFLGLERRPSTLTLASGALHAPSGRGFHCGLPERLIKRR